jgi:long-chain fatty acid transport protein
LSIHLPARLFGGGAMLYEIAQDDVRLASAGWAARARDASTTFTNPAGLTRLQCPQVMFGAQPIYNTVEYKTYPDTTISGGDGDANAWLPAGSLFYALPLNERWTIGFGGVGYFGSSLKYGNQWSGRYYITSTLLQGLSSILSAGYQVADRFSIGIGVNVMYSFFKSESAVNNSLDALPDGSLKLKKNAFGAGYILGALYEVTPWTRIGIQYLSQVRLKLKCTPRFANIGPTIQGYLNSTGLENGKITVLARVPAQVMLSVYHDICDEFSVMGNLGWQQWSRFNKVDINVARLDIPTITVANQYKDTFHVAGGVEYYYSPCLTFSSGVAYDTTAVDTEHRTFTFPIGGQWRIGTGVEYALRENLELSLGYEILFSPNLRDNQNVGALVGHVDGYFKTPHSQFFELCAKWTY